MNEKIDAAVAALNDITADVTTSFGMLSANQLNWRPATGGWSVAQCLDHLILTNTEIFPAIDAKLAGGNNSFWEKYSPLTGFFGSFLKKSLVNDGKKFKAPSKSIEPPSDLPPDIVAKFAANQSEMIRRIEKSRDIDLRRSVITSPFMRLMTYSINDGIEITVEHEKRHIRQAKRVAECEGFPGA